MVIHVKSVEALSPHVDMEVWRKGFKHRCRSRHLIERLKFTRTATAGSDVVQSGRPIFDDFFRISAITRRMLSSKWSSACGLSA
ncbi:hypothetical protein TNCV_4661041 [Trichonephila clavipes]|uniref:Uncharacterized protein n=1 Tax=Trichonephila clavipes TaxID=2585209 RepID=A0A8X6S7K1_TRICX|nr:hypothetical protein TNCV_4661041 [Trichonephila clavipes]